MKQGINNPDARVTVIASQQDSSVNQFTRIKIYQYGGSA
jgi:hypothetical protein